MTIKRLGKGLADIITTAAPGATSNFVSLRTDQIRENRLQPRATTNEAALEELKASIARQGIIEPVIVRPIAHGIYELVAGERRWRAAKAIGLSEVPAIIKSLSDKETLEYSLVENIQRENLNPWEEAKGYARLVEEFGYTQEEVAATVGKDRVTVANILRLLRLPEEIQQGLRDGSVSLGHAKALLSVESRVRRLELYLRTTKEHLSVRQLEALAGVASPSRRRRNAQVDPQLKSLEDGLRQALGTKVTVSARKKGGRIVIDYFSQEDLARILNVLGVSAS
ncbi:MAG: ParB/RepB/Spo0J family partition protein [Candidatus Omnitrophota bacterium]|nr:ParB/RepB/Spo0J family partition protein [Candidatus Omnitrophota bacterium]